LLADSKILIVPPNEGDVGIQAATHFVPRKRVRFPPEEVLKLDSGVQGFGNAWMTLSQVFWVFGVRLGVTPSRAAAA
jgi:hypothetical protein